MTALRTVLGLLPTPCCPLSTQAQSSACRLQAELDKLRGTGFLESSEAEEVTQLKVEVVGEQQVGKGE